MAKRETGTFRIRSAPPLEDLDVQLILPAKHISAEQVYSLLDAEPQALQLRRDGSPIARDDIKTRYADGDIIILSWNELDDGFPVRLLQRLGIAPYKTKKMVVAVVHADEVVKFAADAVMYTQLKHAYMPALNLFEHTTMVTTVIDAATGASIKNSKRYFVKRRDGFVVVALDKDDFQEFVRSKCTYLAGNTVVVDVRESRLSQDSLQQLLVSAEAEGRERRSSTSMTVIVDKHDALQHATAEEMGFKLNPGGVFLHKFFVDPLPAAAQCEDVVKLSSSDLARLRPALARDIEYMCSVMPKPFLGIEGRIVYASFSPGSTLPCAVALVDVDEDTVTKKNAWEIAYLCSNIPGSGKRLVRHIVADAQLAGKELVCITPANAAVKEHYLKCWMPSFYDKEANEVVYDLSGGRLHGEEGEDEVKTADAGGRRRQLQLPRGWKVRDGFIVRSSPRRRPPPDRMRRTYRLQKLP